MTDPVEISIVVEWENVLLAGEGRCFEMLRQLGGQLAHLGRKAEVVVLYNPDQVERAGVDAALRKWLAPGGSVAVSLEGSKGRHYYQLKNEGATRARGEIVIFMDSDVVPEEGWLEAISQPFFDRPEIGVVAGQTYLTHDGLFQKAFALAWFFPLRDSGNKLHSDRNGFFANNVAFRRDLILKFPFPAMPAGVTRGACGKLARTLVSSGIPIWTNTAARVSHPPPADLQHTIKRALAHGRDIVLIDGQPLLSSAKCLKWFAGRLVSATVRILTGHRRVNLPLWQTPAAVAIMAAFYTLAFLGGCTALLAPRYAADHWQI